MRAPAACLVALTLALLIPASPAAAACGAALSGTPTTTLYLPNITKYLGGSGGRDTDVMDHPYWNTPFIIQNTGSSATQLEVTYYLVGGHAVLSIAEGSCITRHVASGPPPGASLAFIPQTDSELPLDALFSVVVRSFGSTVVGLVNEHSSFNESLAYDGFTSGAASVFLPNVTRRFFGWVTPFIVQNLGAAATVVTASFVSFDGTRPLTVTRTIDPGRSAFIDPNSEPGLVDGTQYAVTLTSPQPIAVVENLHNDADAFRPPVNGSIGDPVGYSIDGITGGADTVYGPYAAKNANGVGRVSTIVVQNLGTTAVRPSLTFTALANTVPAEPVPAPTQTFIAPSDVPPGGSWAFDPRFTLGTTTPCSVPSDQAPATVTNATCLRDGEYSFSATAAGPIAAVVNVISSTTAMGYAATVRPDAKFFLPNVTRTLGKEFGWSTPILIQAVTATGATLRWYRFSDGALVVTHTVPIATGSARRVDPRDVVGLAEDTQYAVVVDGTGGTLATIVIEIGGERSPLPGGGVMYANTLRDSAMIYEGFAATGP
jgi:hypothetical protein